VPVETLPVFPAIDRHTAESLLPSPFARGAFPVGKPFPHSPFLASEAYGYPEAVTTAWPGKYQGPSPFPLKHNFGHYGHGF
jgi:hypothetical protein